MPILKKSMVLDGIAASEAIDSSGEVLDIKGLDITSLQDGSGVLNYEHRGDQSEGASSADIIGAITFAKKIFGPDDCENDRQLGYWNKVQLPFVYIQAELFDSEGHQGAKEAAALIRYYHKRSLPILMRYSIEGSTLKRDGNRLKHAIAKRVAATIKPCNRSCISGVLSDSEVSAIETKAKEGLETLVRFENPNRQFLGGYEGEYANPIVEDPLEKMRGAIDSLREYNDLSKALSAGGFNAAPTSLSGGSALQAENISSVEQEKKKKFIKNQAQAALRDWQGKGDLRKFLKHRLPDTSPEFIEHFAALVEDYQLKKMIELEDNLIKAVAGKMAAPPTPSASATPADALAPVEAKPVKAPAPGKAKSLPTVEQHAGGEDEIAPDDNEPLTIRGKKVRPLPAVQGAHFDERKGILYTQRGSFPMYLPQHDKSPGALESFHNALNDDKTTKFHDYAVSNWLKVHKMLKEGRLPPEVVMHSTLFSQLSPNTPVPMQELMYGHLVDTMNERGVDARSPEFANLKEDWTKRDGAKSYPKLSTDYFTENKSIHLKTKAKLSGRDPGQVGSFMLANNKFKNMEQYHSLHGSLMDLIGRHKHDARAGVQELMNHKYQDGLWEARRQREIEKGRPDIGPYTAGPSVPGLAPKTGRYMYAMVGGGNVHVPDTHFGRYLFGLEKGTDSRSIGYLKSVLWNSNNSDVLGAIDRYYAKHHPAVQHMLQHPVFGKHFENPEDAIFPAFWKNWMVIAPHERARKMKTMAFNEATDHRPFWEAIQPFVKSELENAGLEKAEASFDLPMRTAKLHQKWSEEHGEVAAQMLYYAYIVPQLLRASRRSEDVIVKMNRIADDLRKTMGDQPPAQAPAPQALPPLNKPDVSKLHKVHDKYVQPGEIELVAGPFKGSKLHHLGEMNGKVFVKGQGEHGQHNTLPVHLKGKAYRVLSEPQHIQIPKLIDGNGLDSNLHKTFEQRQLVHGLDLADKPTPPGVVGTLTEVAGVNPGWLRNASGVQGYVKPNVNDQIDWADRDAEYTHAQKSYSLPHREVLYHNMARDFFGLGEHVPATAMFEHPDNGEPVSVQQRVVGGSHFDHDNDEAGLALSTAHNQGKLDKMATMDMLMGNNDRNPGNYMVSKKGVHLIDNGLSLDFRQPLNPHYMWEHHHDSDPFAKPAKSEQREIHPAAHDWLVGLNADQYTQHLAAHGVPERIIKEGYMRFRTMQLKAMEHKVAGKPLTRGDLAAAANTHTDKYSWADEFLKANPPKDGDFL